MHQSALRLPFCCSSGFRGYLCNIPVRRLSNAGTVPVASSDQQALKIFDLRQESVVNTLAKNEKDTKNIFVDDLSATLEAHRASNRAAIIRKVGTNAIDPARTIKRLSLDQDSDGGSEIKQLHEEKENERHQMWPADSVQAKKRYGKRGTTGFDKKGEVLEYTGIAQGPQGPWKNNHLSKDVPMQRPWLAYIESSGENNFERLTNEIKAYEAYMRLSPQEEAASELVISDVNSVARNGLEIKPLTLLGSRSTGLATPISDFDFTFELPISLPGRGMVPSSKNRVSQPQLRKYKNKLEALKVLKKMERHFRLSNKFSITNLVRHARVPIIRSTHIATGLEVQIQTMAPYQAAHDYSIAYLSEFPSLRPLYIVLRYCLALRQLTTVFEGGLGSYTILMMIVTALKHSSGKFTSEDLGGQLLHVLDFYGNADLYKFGFSANPPRVFEKKRTRTDQMQTLYPRKPYLLCLQDPANDLNDLGKMTYAIKHIQAVFRRAKQRIQFDLQYENRYQEDKSEERTWSYMEYLVKADYRWFELHRSRVERCADPTKLDDRDFSEGRIAREFENRVSWYKGVAEEHDKLAMKKAIATQKPEQSLELHGINDDEYGWQLSPSTDQRPLLEAENRGEIFQKPPFGIAFAEALNRTCWPETSRKSQEGQQIIPASKTRSKPPKKDPNHLAQKIQVNNGNDGRSLARMKASEKHAGVEETAPTRPGTQHEDLVEERDRGEASGQGPLGKEGVLSGEEEVHENDAHKGNAGCDDEAREKKVS